MRRSVLFSLLPALALALPASWSGTARAQTTATLEVTAQSDPTCVISGGPVLDPLDFGKHQAGDFVTGAPPHDQFSVTCNSPVPVSVGVDQGQNFAVDFDVGAACPIYRRAMRKPGVALLIPYDLDVSIGTNPNVGGGSALVFGYQGVPTGSGQTDLIATANNNPTPTYYVDLTVKLCDPQLPTGAPSGIYEDLLTINLVW